jgi:methylase of polypeptide subunit release factors
LRQFLKESGYSHEGVCKALGNDDLPSNVLGNVPGMLERTEGRTALNALLRLFWIGTPMDQYAAAEVLPEWLLEAAAACNLLRKEGKELVAEVMIVAFEGFLVACDRTARFESRQPDLVLWPNPTSRLLANFTMRRQSRKTLDIGTGSAVEALLAASHSEKVIATDINERALNLAAFNARLNGIENIAFALGDGLAPVRGEKFDLIVSNPPFFITPSDHWMFCDNPMELDQLCRALARDAANHLSEGGYFQMLCEWAEVQDQPWRARLAEWFLGTGCDVWILKMDTRSPLRYTQDRIRELALVNAVPTTTFRDYTQYYRERKVKAIHGGIVAIRRRSGENWMVIEEAASAPQEPFGDFVLGRFAAQDFVRTRTAASDMLAAKFALAPKVRMEQQFKQDGGQWNSVSLNLKLAPDFPFSLPVQPLVARFVSGCDGTRTLAEMVRAFAADATVPYEQVESECVEVVRTLVARGYLLPV